MARIANFKIDEKIRNLESFENYNATIDASLANNHYVILHWNTLILDFNTDTQEIEYLRADFISQTTSTLVGRIVRSLPHSAVLSLIKKLGENGKRDEQRRLIRMARL